MKYLVAIVLGGLLVLGIFYFITPEISIGEKNPISAKARAERNKNRQWLIRSYERDIAELRARASKGHASHGSTNNLTDSGNGTVNANGSTHYSSTDTAAQSARDKEIAALQKKIDQAKAEIQGE